MCDPKNPKSCVQPLLQGEAAPFSGQLLSFKRAAVAAVGFQICGERIQLKLEETEALWKIRLQLAKDTAEIELGSRDQQIKILERALKQAQKVVWYHHPAFITGLTATILVAILVGSIKVYQALENN